MSELTDKQQTWLDEYLQCWNGAEAARRAGYSSVYQSAHDNLTNPKIQEEIALRLNLNVMSANEALSRLADMARANVGDFIEFDSAGTRVWRIDLLNAKDADKLHVLTKLWYANDGHPHIELHDSQKALEMILRAHGAFVDRTELTGADGGPVKVEDVELTDDERASRIAAILDAARARRDQQAGNE